MENNFAKKVKLFFKEKVKVRIPGLGFGFLLIALVFSILAFWKYYDTYEIANYDINRWATMFSSLAIWCIAFLMINSLFCGDRPVWSMVIYACAAFLLVLALLKLIQPCVSEIAFVYGSPDLAMGDNKIRVEICDSSILTAIFYVIAAVCTIVAAFLPAEWTFGKKKKKQATENVDTTENADMTDVDATENSDMTETADVEENSATTEAADATEVDTAEAADVTMREEDHE